MSKTQLTDLDQKLIEIASRNPTQFINLVGEDAWIAAKICFLRQDQNSYGSIAYKLKLSREKARYRCNRCECKALVPATVNAHVQ